VGLSGYVIKQQSPFQKFLGNTLKFFWSSYFFAFFLILDHYCLNVPKLIIIKNRFLVAQLIKFLIVE